MVGIRQAAAIIFNIENQQRTFAVFCLLSFLGHLFLFGLAAWAHLPGYSNRVFYESAAISVDLVAFNPNPPGSSTLTAKKDSAPPEIIKSVEPAHTEPAPPAEPEAITVKTAVAEKTNPSDFVVKAPDKPKTKTSLKSRTMDTSKVLETAARRIEKQVEKAPSEPLSDRIAQLRKEVGDYSGILGQTQGAGQAKSHGRGGSSGPPPRGELEQIAIFQAEVSIRLKSNWVFSEDMAGDTRGLESRLVIKIMPNGSITDVWFEKRSGNAYLDNSAYKTVMKSNPLPPLPAGYPYYHLVVGFTPSGIY